MVKTLALGIYIQTEVMSTISVPAYSETIETIEDLKKATDARKISPCINKGMRSASFIQGSKTGVAKTLGSLMREHPDCCIFPGEGDMCYRLAQNGTYVYILVRLPPFHRRGEQYRLPPSEECFVVDYGTTYIYKAFPYNKEYHPDYCPNGSGATHLSGTQRCQTSYPRFLKRTEDNFFDDSAGIFCVV